MKYLTFLAILLLAIGCDECCNELPDGQSLQGKWQVVEVGFSPGAGYVTAPVDQGKFIEFGSDHKFSSNYEGLEDIHFYRINDETGNPVLELFPKEPKDYDPDQLVYKYRMGYDDSMLKLMYAYCIEGCHIGIQRVN
ncbi:MAG TPA: hypothetical protein DHN29_17655 [Cytophagales bacterium]|nr:hypothetical protein [Cytophagales bacterium]